MQQNLFCRSTGRLVNYHPALNSPQSLYDRIIIYTARLARMNRSLSTRTKHFFLPLDTDSGPTLDNNDRSGCNVFFCIGGYMCSLMQSPPWTACIPLDVLAASERGNNNTQAASMHVSAIVSWCIWLDVYVGYLCNGNFKERKRNHLFRIMLCFLNSRMRSADVIATNLQSTWSESWIPNTYKVDFVFFYGNWSNYNNCTQYSMCWNMNIYEMRPRWKLTRIALKMVYLLLKIDMSWSKEHTNNSQFNIRTC